MYIDEGINWRKYIKTKSIYIFGGGKKGLDLYKRLDTIGITNVVAIIDNSAEVVNSINGGNGWMGKAFLPVEYKSICNCDKDIIISTDYLNIKYQLMNMGIYNIVSKDEIDLTNRGESHYNEEYFKTQLEYAKVDSIIDKMFFQRYISPNDDIVEFGCGGGLLLRELQCKSKVGIEINGSARSYAEKIGINTLESIDDIDDCSKDIVISTHALEHCTNPYEIVCKLKNKLKVGGRAIFVVPYEPLNYEYLLNDLSQHLFIWNERTLGNLFRAAGYYIRETGSKEVAWPRGWKDMFDSLDIDTFNAISSLETFKTGYYSVFVIAER